MFNTLITKCCFPPLQSIVLIFFSIPLKKISRESIRKKFLKSLLKELHKIYLENTE